MAVPRPSIFTAASQGWVCPRPLVVIMMLAGFPAWSWALNAQLRWTPSPDSRVTGYRVYVRQARTPYGAPRDAGAPPVAADGTVSWVVTGLSSNVTYFMAVSAYTGSGIESALSDELALGTPDPCVDDVCTSPTQCTVSPLPDGSACGAPAAGACGSTCQGGSCLGAAQHGFTLSRLRVRLSDTRLRAVASGQFVTSPQFDPLTSGLLVTVADGTGTPVAQVPLGAASFTSNRDGSVVKLARQKRDTTQVQIQSLLLRIRGSNTSVKLRLSAPPPAALPQSATVMLQSGGVCLVAAPLGCQTLPRAISCR